MWSQVFKIKSADNGVSALAAFVYSISYPCILSTQGRDVLIISLCGGSEQHSSTLCLQAEGGRLDFWNEAIENQLTLQHGALKFRSVKLPFVLFSLVWISGQRSANKVKRMSSRFYILGGKKKKKVTEKDFIFSNDWIQMNSQCKKENVFSLKRPRQEGRNKHAPHASFCYSSLSFGLKMEHLWRNSTSVWDL